MKFFLGQAASVQLKSSSPILWYFSAQEEKNFLLLYCRFSTVCRPAFTLSCMHDIKYHEV